MGLRESRAWRRELRRRERGLSGCRKMWLRVRRGETIQSEFLKSPNHRANMLDSDMDSIGVGVVERRGQLFAVEDFSKAK